MNMIPSKNILMAFAASLALMIGGCSGIKGGTTSGGGGTGGGGTGPFTIGGTIVGLKGTGLVIENNGVDDLGGFKTDGPFVFKTAVTGPYVVLVKTQPTATPAQTCTVQNGKGTATANVTNVQIVCGTVYFIGGTVNGLAGTGMVLQDNATDDLSITGTGTVPFTFLTPLPVGAPYAVTISKSPASPAQACTINNGTGTVNGPVTNIDIVCPQPKYSISGTLIGLVDNGGVGNSVELKDNAGDDFLVTGNNSVFTLPTQVTVGGTYSVTVFREPFSQPQPCNIFNANGLVLANVSNVQVDCQHNDWAWISQDSTNTANHYATAVLPPPFPNLNTPGARHYAMTWTDTAGQKWMFGGVGYPLASTPAQPVSVITDDRLNDLWVWSGSEDVGAWTPANLPICVDLSFKLFAQTLPLEFLDLPGAYGTQGVANPNSTDGSCATGNFPGGRWGAATWSDASGNLWMFGGQGYDAANVSGDVFLNDLWEFIPTTPDFEGTYEGSWIWVAGPNTGNRAGLPNYPGGRWAPSVVTDKATNTVWMFGGKGYDSAGNFGFLNDLWKLNIATHTWTFIAGSQTANVQGVYGTLGTAAPGNVPGGREESILWEDPAGKIFLFGGFGEDSVGTSAGGTPGGTLNDLWEYDPVTTQWTWVSGGGASGIANQNGVYTKQLAPPDPTNMPGSRWGSVGWSDASGNLWLFGGWGYNALAINGTGFMNDTWEYQRSSNQWIWWKGSSGVNQNGNYLWHISQTDNVPGARRGQALWQPDGLDFIWIFGGQGFDKSSATGNDYLNDLWHYLPFP
jgi:hypothetical protein